MVGQIIVPRNIDCVKVCPLDSTLLAIAFYQQLPELTGGIALHSLTCPLETLSNIVIEDYGPILHLCWLDRIINDSYYLFAAARNGRVLIIEVRVDVLKPSL